MNDAPLVSVIIPVRDDLVGLRTCLRALEAQDYPPARIEVIVVDNGSQVDLSPAIPDDPRFQMIVELEPGSYVARNTGVEVARGQVLAFTDADCVPHADWVSAGVAALHDRPPRDAVGGAINLTFLTLAGPRTGPDHYELLQEFQQRRYVEEWSFAATANLFVDAAMFRRTGGFDAALHSGGDLDWGNRLRDLGGRLVYDERPVIDHPARSSWGELRRKTVRVAHGIADRLAPEGRQRLLDRAASEARAAILIWARVWSQPRPADISDKLRFAAAYSFVRVHRVGVHLRRASGARRPST